MTTHIYVERVVRVVQDLPPAPEGTLNLGILSWFPNNVHHGLPLYQLSPYYLKDDQGHIMENIWQGSKVYPTITEQYQIKGGSVIWQHPSEVHVKNNEITPQFWVWRKKVWNNPYPVRFPNGFHGKSCLCALWYEDDQWSRYQYIEARKKIYCRVYEFLVKKTACYAQLKKLYDNGQSLQICEMDVRPGLVTEEVLYREINNPDEPFGHGYVLTACLMGLEYLWNHVE
jgi:hypothetical protein